jgi:hypothetical protein
MNKYRIHYALLNSPLGNIIYKSNVDIEATSLEEAKGLLTTIEIMSQKRFPNSVALFQGGYQL